MKRLFAVILALCLCLSLGLTVLAAEGEAPYENAGALYQSWYEENPGMAFPYPRCVTGVVSTDGGMENLTFYLLQGTTQEERDALLSLVRDKDSVTFAEGGKYPIAELYEIQETLGAKLAADAESFSSYYGLCGMGIDEQANRLVLDLDISAAGAEDLKEKLRGQYGDRVYFEESGERAIFETVTTAVEEVPGLGVDLVGVPEQPKQEDPDVPMAGEILETGTVNTALAVTVDTTRTGSPGYWPLLAALVCVACSAYVLLRKKPKKQPADGPEQGKAKQKRPPARIQVEAAILTAEETPDEALTEKIKQVTSNK